MAEMNKILPMDLHPIIKTFPSIANYLGILNANKYDTTGILINHYVDLFYAKKSVCFTQRDYIRRAKFERNAFLFTEQNIIDKLHKELNEDHYVLLILNEQFIAHEEIHKDHFYCHDWLVYGYDDEKSVFKIMGYYGSNALLRIYGSVDISFEDVKLGALAALNVNHIYKGTDLDNNTICIKNTDIEEKINLPKIKKDLNRYIKGHILFCNNKFFLQTGKNVIEILIKEHTAFQQKASNKKPPFYDIRNYRFCLENKKVILLIITKYLNDFNLATRYQNEVINSLNIIITLIAKYYIKPDPQINDRVINLLIKVQQAEKEIMEEFLAII